MIQAWATKDHLQYFAYAKDGPSTALRNDNFTILHYLFCDMVV
jgi:hypothetical protein